MKSAFGIVLFVASVAVVHGITTTIFTTSKATITTSTKTTTMSTKTTTTSTTAKTTFTTTKKGMTTSMTSTTTKKTATTTTTTASTSNPTTKSMRYFVFIKIFYLCIPLGTSGSICNTSTSSLTIVQRQAAVNQINSFRSQLALGQVIVADW